MATKWRHRYIRDVELLVLSGLETNADIARALNVSVAAVKAWRTKYKAFDDAIESTLSQLLVESVEVVRHAIRGGDISTAKWMLERRSPAFRPQQKIEHSADTDTLDVLLKQRASMQDLAEQGIIDNDD